MSLRAKKLQWFDRGAEVFEKQMPGVLAAKLGPDATPAYVCPLCLVIYTRDAVLSGLLTAEHVPPETQGGKPLVLTCKTCNDEAGRSLDSHAWNKERVLAALRGEPTDGISIQLGADDQLLNAVFSVRDGIHFIDIAERHNRRGATRAFADSVTGTRKPLRLTFHRDRFDDLRAKVSWLRAAYLTLFAIFGYSVACARSTVTVREQIADPTHRRIPCFGIQTPKHIPVSARRLFLVQQPEWLAGWIVQFGSYCCLLPSGPQDVTFYDRIEQHLSAEPIELTGFPRPFPRGPFVGI